MRSFTNQMKRTILSLILLLAISAAYAQPWTPPTGHPSGGQWTFFTAKAQIDGVDMVAGDQLAVFDGATLVGAFTLTQVCTEENMYSNQWIAYEKLDVGGSAVQGYTPGNAYTFKAWRASTNTIFDNMSLTWNTLVGNGHEHTHFPPANTYTWDYPQIGFFDSPGTIQGYVKKLADNTPIANATAKIVETGQTATTDPAGFYQFGTVIVGTYTLAYSATGYGNDTVFNVSVAANGTTNVPDVLLTTPPGSITGTVSNSDGPLAGASVTANPGAFNTTTNGSGVYTLSNLPPGSYTVTASATYHANGNETVAVTSNNTTTQNFLLTKTNGSLQVTVKDGVTNLPISGASVDITPGGSASTNASGIATFNNLAAGNYSIEVTDGGYLTANGNATVNNGYQTAASIFMISALPTYPANYTAFPGGNPNEPVWTIYIREAFVGPDELLPFDAIAVYDGATLVGVGYLTEVASPANEFTNFVSVFSELNNGDPGYTVGNTFTIEAYRYADQQLYSASVTLTDPYATGAYVGSTFPNGDNVFSFASLNLGVTPGDIDGTVTDLFPNPIEGASLTAVNTSTMDEYFATTDFAGAYEMTGLPPGTYDITATAIGFDPETVAGVVVPNAGSVTQNLALTPQATQNQDIQLSTGYQFVSTRMQAADMDMDILVNGIKPNLDFIKSTAGSIFHEPVPLNWVNNIGDWVVTEGYLFDMTGADMLTITGHPVPQNTPIAVSPGFQFIAYLPDVSLDAQYAMASILNDMEYLRASDGSYLRKIGPTWVNNIGTMNPGEGYLLKMKPLKSTSAYTLTYPAAVLATLTTTNASGITVDEATIGGNISAHGNAAITDRGVYWGTDPDPITNGAQVPLGTGSGSFSHLLTGLNYNVTYYFAAYAVNVAGEAYGTIKSFVPVEGPVINTTQNNSYMTFAAAIAAANDDDNLVLDDDISEATVTIDKPLTIDFGNYTLTGDLQILNAGAFTVNITGNADGIAEWDVTGTLTVNSPGTAVNNSAEFQGASPSIYITTVGVFTEDGEGNWIEVDGSANGISIVVEPNGSVQIDIEAGAIVASIVIDENATGVAVNNEGTVESIENNADGTEINNNGTIEELENTGEGVDYNGTLPDQTIGGPPSGYVLNENSGLLYNNIQDAIDAASANDVLIAGAGTYTGNLEINVSGLTLRSLVQHEAIIQTVAGFNGGSGYGGITILADNVTLEGFRIEQDVAQAVVHTHNTNNAYIKDNAIFGLSNAAPRGIDVGFASANSDGVIVEGNTFNDLYCGVYINRATDMLVDANTFEDMGDGALVFDGSWYYGNINVMGNTATDANYLLYFYGTQGPVTQSNNTLINTLLNNLSIYNTTQGTSHATIQDAIDNATANDVIDVAAGTYTENIALHTGVTLKGANANLACGSRGTETIIAPAAGLPLNVTSDGVTINGFEITAPDYQYAVLCSNTSDLYIVYNNIHNIGTYITNTNVHAIQYTVPNATSTNNVTVSDNCFDNISSSALTGYSASAIGFLQSTSTGDLTGLNIERNTINNVSTNNGQWPTGKIAYGIQINVGGSGSFLTTGKVVNAVIRGNTISNLSGHIATGIGLEGNTENALVELNEVSNLSGTKWDAVSAGYDISGLKFEKNRYASDVTVVYNKFMTNTYESNGTPNLGYAVSNYVTTTDGGIVNVSCNWFGTAVEAEIEHNLNLDGKILNKTGCQTDFIPYLVTDDIDNPDCTGGL